MKKIDRFSNWKYPKIEEGKPTKYNWVVHCKIKNSKKEIKKI